MNAVHIVVAMKPIEGNFADNALELGVAGINIDDCRIGMTTRTNSSKPAVARIGVSSGMTKGTETEIKDHGRFPANVVHDGSEEVVDEFPNAGGCDGRVRDAGEFGKFGKYSKAKGASTQTYTDEGSAARFFKECKS